MTTSYDGLECYFDADADFMYVLHDSIVNGRIIVVPTQNPGYVKLCLSSLENVHELLQSSITIHEERVCISPKKLKEEFGKRINEQRTCPVKACILPNSKG